MPNRSFEQPPTNLNLQITNLELSLAGVQKRGQIYLWGGTWKDRGMGLGLLSGGGDQSIFIIGQQGSGVMRRSTASMASLTCSREKN